MRSVASASAFAVLATLGARAHALTIELEHNPPAERGTTVSFRATAIGEGDVTYTWDFGDGTRIGPVDSGSIEHTYGSVGHYPVIAIASDASGVRSASFIQTIHHPLTSSKPAHSSTIVVDDGAHRVCVVNADHDSVTCLDEQTLTPIFVAPVGRHPRTLTIAGDGTLWVANQASASISVLAHDGSMVEELALPRGSAPYGITASPPGDVVYVALSGTGQVAAFDVEQRDVLTTMSVAPTPAGLAVSADGTRVLVTRFLSPDEHGEVIELDGADLTVTRRFQLSLDPGPDTEATSRGVPNYLRSVVISPDALSAWVPSKKDNIVRGAARDGEPLTFETSVRTIVSPLDLVANAERLDGRVDLNNRSMGLAAAMSPFGDYVFVALLGNNGVEVFDAYDGRVVGGAQELGKATDGVAVGAGGRLFVHSFLSRTVHVLDVSGVLDSSDFRLPVAAEADTVPEEILAPEVLRGKQMFYDAADPRMSRDGYLSCATCHLDGFEDARVWDFTDRGEGLRNTISLLGRRGTGQGPLHWSANFDEVQDFEHDIRSAFGGTGFMSEADFTSGTHGQTLGEPKAGISADLDALAIYVSSLDLVPDSPYRDPDGTLTAEGWAGREVFDRAGCRECHGGPDFTDSATGVRHDVGTMKSASGQRLGGTLDGFDTPTLRGIWQTAPYLHDGSAETLSDVLATPEHGDAEDLTDGERAELVAYLLQIDNVSFEDEQELPPTEDAGAPDAQADGPGEAGLAMDAPAAERSTPSTRSDGSCACRASGSSVPTRRAAWLALAGIASAWRRRRGSREAAGERREGCDHGRRTNGEP